MSLSQSLVKNTRVNHWVFHKAHLYCRRMIRLEGSFPSPINIAFNKKKKKDTEKLTRKVNHRVPIFAVFSCTQAALKVTH